LGEGAFRAPQAHEIAERLRRSAAVCEADSAPPPNADTKHFLGERKFFS